MAGGTHADRDDMLPSGFEAEGLIKGGNVVNPAQRQVHFDGNVGQDIFGQIVEGLMNILKDGHKGALIDLVPGHNGSDFIAVFL
jgi:hypothetical protein